MCKALVRLLLFNSVFFQNSPNNCICVKGQFVFWQEGTKSLTCLKVAEIGADD